MNSTSRRRLPRRELRRKFDRPDDGESTSPPKGGPFLLAVRQRIDPGADERFTGGIPTLLAIGGIWSGLLRRAMRASSTERASSPGAMMRALVMPRLPAEGKTSQAPVCASAVPWRRSRLTPVGPRGGGSSHSSCAGRRRPSRQRLRRVRGIGVGRRIRCDRRRQHVDLIQRRDLVRRAAVWDTCDCR